MSFGGPFDITELLGSDRLLFANRFVGPPFSVKEELGERAEEFYRTATVEPAEPNESDSEIIITGEETYRVDVEVYHPLYSLERVRDARNDLDAVTPESTLTEVEIHSINVGAAGRNRGVLSKNIWLEFRTQRVMDLGFDEEARLESFIRGKTGKRVDVKQSRSNIVINTGASQEKLFKLIEFASEAGDEIREQQNARIGGLSIAAGNNFSFTT